MVRVLLANLVEFLVKVIELQVYPLETQNDFLNLLVGEDRVASPFAALGFLGGIRQGDPSAHNQRASS